MNKSAKRNDGRKAAGVGQLWLRLPGLVREALYDTLELPRFGGRCGAAVQSLVTIVCTGRVTGEFRAY